MVVVWIWMDGDGWFGMVLGEIWDSLTNWVLIEHLT
jgi:hypothetical protein